MLLAFVHLLFLIFTFTTESIILTPSKWILTPFDPHLTLYCSLPPLSLKYKLSRPQTPLIFRVNRKVIFNSSSPESSFKSGVTHLNLTTISIQNATSGISNATCSFAEEQSPKITVPFIEKVIYAASKIANKRQCSLVKCTAKMAPLMPKFTVNFELKGETIGQWKIEGTGYFLLIFV